MPDVLVEIHVPLIATPGLPDTEYQFPWIEEIEGRLADMSDDGTFEVPDDGEEFGNAYVFFITGGDETRLLQVAQTIVSAGDVPASAFALVTDPDTGEMGVGRRVDFD